MHNRILQMGGDGTRGIGVAACVGRASLQALNFEPQEFKFTSQDVGMHEICFANSRKDPRRVQFDLEAGQIKDYSELIKSGAWRAVQHRACALPQVHSR